MLNSTNLMNENKKVGDLVAESKTNVVPNIPTVVNATYDKNFINAMNLSGNINTTNDPLNNATLAAITAQLSDYYYIRLTPIIESVLANLTTFPIWSSRTSASFTDASLTDATLNKTCDFAIHQLKHIDAGGETQPISEYMISGRYELTAAAITVGAAGATTAPGAYCNSAFTCRQTLRSRLINYTLTQLAKDSLDVQNVPSVSAISYATMRTNVGPVSPVAISRLVPNLTAMSTIVPNMINLLTQVMYIPDDYAYQNCPWFDIRFAAGNHTEYQNATYAGNADMLAFYTNWDHLREDLTALTTAAYIIIPYNGNETNVQLKARIIAYLGPVKRSRFALTQAAIWSAAAASQNIGAAGNIVWSPNASFVELHNVNPLIIFLSNNIGQFAFDGVALNRPALGAPVSIAARFDLANHTLDDRIYGALEEIRTMATFMSAREFLEAMIYVSAMTVRLPFINSGYNLGNKNDPAMQWHNGASRTATMLGTSTTNSAVANFYYSPTIIGVPSGCASNCFGQINASDIGCSTNTVLANWAIDFTTLGSVALTTPSMDSSLYSALLLGLVSPVNSTATAIYNAQISNPFRLWSFVKAISAIALPIGINNQVNMGMLGVYAQTVNIAAMNGLDTIGIPHLKTDLIELKQMQSLVMGSSHALSLLGARNDRATEFTDGVASWAIIASNGISTGAWIPMYTTLTLYNAFKQLTTIEGVNLKQALCHISNTNIYMRVYSDGTGNGVPGPYWFPSNPAAVAPTNDVVYQSMPLINDRAQAPHMYLSFGNFNITTGWSHPAISVDISNGKGSRMWELAAVDQGCGEVIGWYVPRLPTNIELFVLGNIQKAKCSVAYEWKYQKSGDMVLSDLVGIIGRKLIFPD